MIGRLPFGRIAPPELPPIVTNCAHLCGLGLSSWLTASSVGGTTLDGKWRFFGFVGCPPRGGEVIIGQPITAQTLDGQGGAYVSHHATHSIVDPPVLSRDRTALCP